MSFITDLRNKQDGTQRKGYIPTKAQKALADELPSQKDLIMAEILRQSGQAGRPATMQYANLNAILAARDAVSAEIAANGLREDVSLIGGVTELICKIGLEAACPGRYAKLPAGWDWIGDYAIAGLPFNLYISVKSYYAKERLIVSGTGQGAAPVIGYGLFRDPSEWSPIRVHQYRHRGFVAIYIPGGLYNSLDSMTGMGYPATRITNIYNRPLVRDIADFANDIANVVTDKNLIIQLERL